MKHTIKGFIVYEHQPWHTEPQIDFQSWNPAILPECTRVVVQEHSFEIEIPDDFNPAPQKIKALRASQRKAAADFHAFSTEIERQISELTAIESS